MSSLLHRVAKARASRLAITSFVVGATATVGLAILASVWLVVENVAFFAVTAVLALGLSLSAAAVARRHGLAPVAAIVICFVFIAGYLSRVWQRSDDAPGAGLGAAIAAGLSLLLVAGGLVGAALGRARRAGHRE